MSIRRLIFTVATSCALFSAAASAEIITFQFSGAVTYGSPMSVPVGTPVVGTYTYNTSTPAVNKSQGYAYYQIHIPKSMSMTVAGHSITSGKLTVTVMNNTQSNAEDLINLSAWPANLDGTKFEEGVLGFQLASAPGNKAALKGTKLPSSIDASLFDAGPSLSYGFFQRDGGQDGTLLQFMVDKVEALPPAP